MAGAVKLLKFTNRSSTCPCTHDNNTKFTINVPSQTLYDIIIIIKQENDYSDVRQLIAVARALYKIKLKTHMLIVQ